MNKWVAHYFCTACKERLVGYTICTANVCPHCGNNPLRFDTKAGRWVSEEKLTFWQWLIGKEEKGHWEYKK